MRVTYFSCRKFVENVVFQVMCRMCFYADDIVTCRCSNT